MRRFLMGTGAGLALAMVLGAQLTDRILVADRIIIQNEDGKPAVLATVDKNGAGVLVLYDDKGREVFSVRDGRVTGAPPPPSSVPPTRQPVMQLLRIEQIGIDPNVPKEIQTLRTQAAEFETKAKVAQSNAANGDDKAKNLNRQHALEYKTRAQELLAKAARLERELQMSKQRIIGWDGQREITLVTERDLSVALSRMTPGGFLSWTGVRTGLTDESETHSVIAIEPATKPTGFVEKGNG